MAGLLDSLDSLLGSADLGSLVDGQGTELGGIISSVQGLIDGPTEFTSLEGIIDAVPLPPGLEGIGNLSTSLSGFSTPTDFSGPLGQILTPLTSLSGTLTGGSAAQFTSLVDMVREIIRLVSGRVFGGPSGMPDGDGIQIPELPDVDELRDAIAQARSIVQDLGPSIDAARLLEFLQIAANGFATPLIRFPNLPVIDETMEAMQTVAHWQSLTPDQLNANLARTLEMAAELISTPRTRVAAPVLDAAGQVTNGLATLSMAQTTLTEVFTSVRPKILTATAHPRFSELRRIETTTETLEKLANALHPQLSPLAQVRGLDEALTRSLLVVTRALQPAYDITPIADKVQELLGNLPETTPDLFTDVTTAIDEFDLSVLTDALQTVRDAVQSAVDEVDGVKETVSTELESLLSPVETALDSALTSAGFTEIQNALESLPGEIEDFVNNEVLPAIEPVREGIETAVDAVAGAATSFDPETLIAPIRDAVEEVAGLLNSDAVRSAFAEVDNLLENVIQTLENLDLSAAADESISLIGDIEVKVEGIDPSSIPDAAKPVIEQAVKVVTDINFSAEVSDPVATVVQIALVEGPGVVLEAMEEGVDELRNRLTQFKPSNVIGEQLDAPFTQLIETLREFKPSDLLNQLQDTLNGMADRLSVLDVGAVVDPLADVHSAVVSQVEALRPSVLLQPVNDAIDDAIDKVYEATQVDTLFDGINDAMEYIQSWTGLLEDTRDLLRDGANLFSEPGDASAAVNELVEEAVAKLDQVDLTRLQAAFASAGEAVHSIERDVIAGDLARALQQAGQQGLPVLNASAAQQVITLIRAFPLDTLLTHQPIPVRRRLIEALERLNRVADIFEAARQPWSDISTELNNAAADLQEKLLDYYKVQQLNGGGVFAQFRDPPTTVDQLKQTVREALQDNLHAPLTTIIAVFQALSPYIQLLAQGVSDIIDALHTKVDSIVGDEGVGGTVNAVEEAANLLRDIDLAPITDPLDNLYGRIETAVNALSPEPLRAVLETARDAIGDLLSLSTIIDQTTIDTLDGAYNTAVEAIGALAPSEIIASTLDPVYEDLLADFLPVLDLPARLRELLEAAGRTLGDDVVIELARVEVAFDDMLRAIPVATGASGAQASASLSVG